MYMKKFKQCPYCGSKEFTEKELKDEMSYITNYSTEAKCGKCKEIWYSDLI